MQLNQESLISLKESYLSQQGLLNTQLDSGIDILTGADAATQESTKPQSIIDTTPVSSASVSPSQISPTQPSSEEPDLDFDEVSDINIGSPQQVITRPPSSADTAADITPTAQSTDEGTSVSDSSQGEINSDSNDGQEESDSNTGGISNGLFGAVVGGLSGALLPKPDDGLNVDLGPVLDAVATLLRGPIRNAIANRRTSSAVLVERTDDLPQVRPTPVVPIPKFARVPSSKLNLIPVGGGASGLQSRQPENGFIPLSSQEAFPDHILPRVDSELDIDADNAIDGYQRPQISQSSQNIYITNNGAPIVDENDPHIYDILDRYEHSYLYNKNVKDPLKIKIVPGGTVNKVQYQQNTYQNQGQSSSNQGAVYNAPPVPPPKPNGPPPGYGSHVETPYSTKIIPKQPQQAAKQTYQQDNKYQQPNKHQETPYSQPIQRPVKPQNKPPKHHETPYSNPIKHAETPYTKPLKPVRPPNKPYNPVKQPYGQSKPPQKRPIYNQRPQQDKRKPIYNRPPPQGPPPGYGGGKNSPVSISNPSKSQYGSGSFQPPKPKGAPPPSAYKPQSNKVNIVKPVSNEYQSPSSNPVPGNPFKGAYVPPSVNAPISSYASPQVSNPFLNSVPNTGNSNYNGGSNSNYNGGSNSNNNGGVNSYKSSQNSGYKSPYGNTDNVQISNAPGSIYTNSFVPVNNPSSNYRNVDAPSNSENSGYKSSTRPPLSSYSGAVIPQADQDDTNPEIPNYAIITPVTRPQGYSKPDTKYNSSSQPQSAAPVNPFLYTTPQTSNEYTPIIVTQSPSYSSSADAYSYTNNNVNEANPIPSWGSAEITQSTYDNANSGSVSSDNGSGSQSTRYASDYNTQYNAGTPLVASTSAPVPVTNLRYTTEAPAVSYSSPAPAVSYSSPAPAVSYNSPAPAVSNNTPAPAVSYYSPATTGYSQAVYKPPTSQTGYSSVSQANGYSTKAPPVIVVAANTEPSTARPFVSTGYSKASYNIQSTASPKDNSNYASQQDFEANKIQSNPYNVGQQTTERYKSRYSRPTTPWYNTTPSPVYKYQSGSRKRVDTVNYPVTDKQSALADPSTEPPTYDNRKDQDTAGGFNYNDNQRPGRLRPVSTYQDNNQRRPTFNNQNTNYNPKVEATTNKISRVPYPGSQINTKFTDTSNDNNYPSEVQIDVPSYGVPETDTETDSYENENTNRDKIKYDPRDKTAYVNTEASKKPRKKYYNSNSALRRPSKNNDNTDRISVDELEPSFTVSAFSVGDSYTRPSASATRSVESTKLDYQGKI